MRLKKIDKLSNLLNLINYKVLRLIEILAIVVKIRKIFCFLDLEDDLLKFSIYNTNLKEIIFEIFELSSQGNQQFLMKIENDQIDHEIIKYLKLEAAWILINLLNCNLSDIKILIHGNSESNN
jgi:hypothetical protein